MFEEDDRFIEILFISDEADFELTSYVIKQNKILKCSTNDVYITNVSQCCLTFFEQNHWAVFFCCQLCSC
jgi:hypothetical protein